MPLRQQSKAKAVPVKNRENTKTSQKSKTAVVPMYTLHGGYLPSFRTRLRYCDAATFNPANVSFSYYTLRCNSLFDPDFQVGGHQPMGFDNLASVYASYTVHSAKITATFSTTEETSLHTPIAFGVLLHEDGSPYTTKAYSLVEQGQSKTVICSAVQAQSKQPIVKAAFSAKEFFNVKDVADNPNLSSAVTGSPSSVAYWILWAGDLTQTVDLASCWCSFIVDYDVEFKRTRELVES